VKARKLLVTNRREFIRSSGLFSVAAGLAGGRPLNALAAAASRHPQLVAEVELDLNRIHKWDDSNGDTWDPFWADDDLLYSFNCDGRGFGKAPRNLAFNKFEGNRIEETKGVQVNPMDEYGPADQHGPDNATWKACGQECIDGVFYAFVSQRLRQRESRRADAADFIQCEPDRINGPRQNLGAFFGK